MSYYFTVTARAIAQLHPRWTYTRVMREAQRVFWDRPLWRKR